MKVIFPLLLCYVLMISQGYALSGGPVFTNSSVAVSGTYSGTLGGITPSDPDHPSTITLGLFVISVPTVGLATGTFILFAKGFTYTGSIEAVADPRSGLFSGLVNAQHYDLEPTSFSDGTSGTIKVEDADASGAISATIHSRSNGSARLSGSAVLTVTPVGTSTFTRSTIVLNVSGFQQSASAVTLSTTGTATTGTTGGVGTGAGN